MKLNTSVKQAYETVIQWSELDFGPIVEKVIKGFAALKKKISSNLKISFRE